LPDKNELVLCFFDIKDFKMSQFGKQDDSSAYIISEQQNVDSKHIDDIIDHIHNKNKIHPINMDIEYTYDSKNSRLNRQYYLSDGNHRIMALKKTGYTGMVPAFVCDYLPNIL
jgi:hypothetical protein